MATHRALRHTPQNPSSGEWRAVVGCDPNCEVRHVCHAAQICCARDDLLKQRILARARTLVYLMKDFAVREIVASGLSDVYVFQRFRQYIEQSEAKRLRQPVAEPEPKRAKQP